MTPAQRRAREDRASAQRAQTGRSAPARPESSAPSQARYAHGSGPLQSRIWRDKIIPMVIRKDAGICHACRAMGCQGTGADSADHHPVPASECEARGIDWFDNSNLRAIHFKACPFCGVKCNTVKGSGSMDAFRIKWETQTGRQASSQVSSASDTQEGREW